MHNARFCLSFIFLIHYFINPTKQNGKALFSMGFAAPSANKVCEWEGAVLWC
jgi:hypothetical protein